MRSSSSFLVLDVLADRRFVTSYGRRERAMQRGWTGDAEEEGEDCLARRNDVPGDIAADVMERSG